MKSNWFRHLDAPKTPTLLVAFFGLSVAITAINKSSFDFAILVGIASALILLLVSQMNDGEIQQAVDDARLKALSAADRMEDLAERMAPLNPLIDLASEHRGALIDASDWVGSVDWDKAAELWDQGHTFMTRVKESPLPGLLERLKDMDLEAKLDQLESFMAVKKTMDSFETKAPETEIPISGPAYRPPDPSANNAIPAHARMPQAARLPHRPPIIPSSRPGPPQYPAYSRPPPLYRGRR